MCFPDLRHTQELLGDKSNGTAEIHARLGTRNVASMRGPVDESFEQQGGVKWMSCTAQLYVNIS